MQEVSRKMKAISKSYRWQVKLLGCMLVIMLLAVYARAQGKDEKVFEVVPQQTRAQLIERLKLYVEYQRTKDYQKLYDLYTQSTIKNLFKGQRKEEFVAAYREGDARGISFRLLEFTPTRIDKTVSPETSEGSDDAYSIYGDAKLWRRGETVEKPVAIEAQLKNGEWYFSSIMEIND
jgi:hypothetical protein